MSQLRKIGALIGLSIILASCGATPVAQVPTDVPRTTETTITLPSPTRPAASSPAVSPADPPTNIPTLVPTLASSPTAIPSVASTAVATPLPATATPIRTTATTPPSAGSPAAGTTVLRLAAGSAAGQVGVTNTDGPTTFRIAADGSIRIMDTINKRLLFFNGTSGKLEQTINLSFLQRPTDFVVTGKGDLYVLDGGGWTIDHLAINGKELHNIPLSPATKGLFSTIALTADGRIFGLAQNKSYLLITPGGPLPPEEQMHAVQDGLFTVRSNASFALVKESVRQVLQIGTGQQPKFVIGKSQEQVQFLDINQGMEPYVVANVNGLDEVRRYSLGGDLMGTLQIDQRGCRPTLRPIYIDRPGAVFTMCVSTNGLSIQRYVMHGAQGTPLPLTNVLLTNVPWSPGSLQAAPG
ncbi:MAG: hypothetical protein H0X37_07875 [Herpetosiphonaceae bacterium]|nr:hypothetical protein [Herpetosiphonaceae bacterium]